MSEFQLDGFDLVEELRLRRWARRNYVPAERRAGEWHPVVLDEMRARDRETAVPARDVCPRAQAHERRLPGVERDVSEADPLLPAADAAEAPGRTNELSANRSLCALYVPLPPTHVSIVHPAHEIPAEPNLARAVESAAVEWLR